MQLTSNFSSVDQMATDTSFLVKQLQQYVKYIDAVEKSCYKLLSPLRGKCFNDIEMEHLRMLYGILYPGCTVTQMSRFYHESKQLVINGEDFITAKSRSQRSAAVAAHWPGVLGIDISGEAPVRIGTVVSFIRHSATLKDKTSDTSLVLTRVHVLARVNWFTEHPQRNCFHPSIILLANTYDNDGPASFMPVSRIIARCAIVHDWCKFDYGDDKVCI